MNATRKNVVGVDTAKSVFQVYTVARRLQELGHEVKLMSGRMVKAFVCGNKNDAADARAIYMAAQQPGVKAMAVKAEAQQAPTQCSDRRAGQQDRENDMGGSGPRTRI